MIDPMLHIKDWILIAGIVILAAGVVCLPVGQDATPERPLSLFYREADAGSFVSGSTFALALGALIIAISLFIPSR
jgi:hypothetical protein